MNDQNIYYFMRCSVLGSKFKSVENKICMTGPIERSDSYFFKASSFLASLAISASVALAACALFVLASSADFFLA